MLSISNVGSNQAASYYSKDGYYVRNDDKDNYLNILNLCDVNVGLTPSDGANAQLEDIQPFVDYLKKLTVWSLKLGIRAAKGEKIDEDTDWKKY